MRVPASPTEPAPETTPAPDPRLARLEEKIEQVRHARALRILRDVKRPTDLH